MLKGVSPPLFDHGCEFELIKSLIAELINGTVPGNLESRQQVLSFGSLHN